jgi:ADP-ribose diphosphatase
MQRIYEGKVFSVDVGVRRFPNGTEHRVEIVRHAPSVVLIPFEDDGRVVLIQQYRAPIDRITWEFPAGRVDPGETPEEAARRECEEEIARVPQTLERIRGLFPAPGFCDEELIFFRVRDLRPPPPDSTRKPDEDEDITAARLTVEDARAMVERGEIVDLKTAYALAILRD